MATNNEVAVRKATLTALGATGNTSNEREYDKALIAALTQANPSTKTEVVALVALGGTITGATANDTMTAVADIALSTSNTYTDAAVNAAVNTAIASIENNLADLQAKVNAIIAALKA